MQARANHTQAERDFSRQRGVDPRATTQTTVDQANTALRVSTASLNSAQAEVSIVSLVAQMIRAAEDTVEQLNT